MKRVAFVVTALVVLAGASSACAGVNEPTAPPSRRAGTAQAEDAAKVAEGCNRFAFDLYAHLLRQEGNLFLSPYSISTAWR